ncbi:hypothetical protein FGO68_gene15994 [Halteria grandinella]|uniref:Uncharacterized protein n=1 Tax=Halteria grandinella TaxID=5974 RepID=A0A8J8P4D3_HALGN|nr:hypothetical protein FGO68_gene15994 [Halteria grandinella]
MNRKENELRDYQQFRQHLKSPQRDGAATSQRLYKGMLCGNEKVLPNLIAKLLNGQGCLQFCAQEWSPNQRVVEADTRTESTWDESADSSLVKVRTTGRQPSLFSNTSLVGELSLLVGTPHYFESTECLRGCLDCVQSLQRTMEMAQIAQVWECVVKSWGLQLSI